MLLRAVRQRVAPEVEAHPVLGQLAHVVLDVDEHLFVHERQQVAVLRAEQVALLEQHEVVHNRIRLHVLVEALGEPDVSRAVVPDEELGQLAVDEIVFLVSGGDDERIRGLLLAVVETDAALAAQTQGAPDNLDHGVVRVQVVDVGLGQNDVADALDVDARDKLAHVQHEAVRGASVDVVDERLDSVAVFLLVLAVLHHGALVGAGGEHGIHLGKPYAELLELFLAVARDKDLVHDFGVVVPGEVHEPLADVGRDYAVVRALVRDCRGADDVLVDCLVRGDFHDEVVVIVPAGVERVHDTHELLLVRGGHQVQVVADGAELLQVDFHELVIVALLVAHRDGMRLVEIRDDPGVQQRLPAELADELAHGLMAADDDGDLELRLEQASAGEIVRELGEASARDAGNHGNLLVLHVQLVAGAGIVVVHADLPCVDAELPRHAVDYGEQIHALLGAQLDDGRAEVHHQALALLLGVEHVPDDVLEYHAGLAVARRALDDAVRTFAASGLVYLVFGLAVIDAVYQPLHFTGFHVVVL